VKGGIKEVFMAIASVQVVVCASTMALCKSIRVVDAEGLDERERERANGSSTDIFGKKNRSFFARHDILEKLKLK
jgi:hypothetical protein